ncbi:hypothetical protein BC628DRAFT_1404405 [Trametes gibbosa]|nr:hypothetical protein BC628DRAFT_1404405 [Trametes gibbosa]
MASQARRRGQQHPRGPLRGQARRSRGQRDRASGIPSPGMEAPLDPQAWRRGRERERC